MDRCERAGIPFTPRAKRVLELSLGHAQRLGQERVARPHLLRALLDVRDGSAARTLADLGADPDALAALVDKLAMLGEHEDEDDSAVGFGADRPFDAKHVALVVAALRRYVHLEPIAEPRPSAMSAQR